jgi:hypothetical protein
MSNAPALTATDLSFAKGRVMLTQDESRPADDIDIDGKGLNHMLPSRFNTATTPVFVRRRRRGRAETDTPSASADVVRD